MPAPVTHRTLQNRYEKQEPITVITAYDATFARLVDEVGIDAILVGDSLGNVIQGHRTTIPVTLDEMARHGRRPPHTQPGSSSSLQPPRLRRRPPGRRSRSANLSLAVKSTHQ